MYDKSGLLLRPLRNLRDLCSGPFILVNARHLNREARKVCAKAARLTESLPKKRLRGKWPVEIL